MFETNYDVEDIWIVLNMSTMEVVSDAIPMVEARELVLKKAMDDEFVKFGVFSCDGEYTYLGK